MVRSKIDDKEIVNIIQLMKHMHIHEGVTITFSEANMVIVVRYYDKLIGTVYCNLETNEVIKPPNCQTKEMLHSLFKPLAMVKAMMDAYLVVGDYKVESDYSPGTTFFNGGHRLGDLCCLGATQGSPRLNKELTEFNKFISVLKNKFSMEMPCDNAIIDTNDHALIGIAFKVNKYSEYLFNHVFEQFKIETKLYPQDGLSAEGLVGFFKCESLSDKVSLTTRLEMLVELNKRMDTIVNNHEVYLGLSALTK